MIASFDGLIRTLLIILAIYFLLRFIIRYFGPRLLQYFMKRILKRAAAKFDMDYQEPPKRKESKKTKIDHTSPSTFKVDKDFGEYIDYEEID